MQYKQIGRIGLQVSRLALGTMNFGMVTEAMTHIAIQEALGGKTVEWMEKVTDDQHNSTPTDKRS